MAVTWDLRLTPMHPNYEYLLDFIQRAHPQPETGRFLDYGCGSATVVMEARQRGLEFFGADVFYAASTARAEVAARGLLGDIVREIHGGCLPFPDAYFDMVVNNQVFEHVEQMASALQEIARVLKPGGILLSLFPSQAIVLEPHWGIPLLHRFPKTSRWRFYYLWFWRAIGLGYRKKDTSIRAWVDNVCQWMDTYTYYRSNEEIDALFQHVFPAVEHLEADYLSYKLRSWRWVCLSIRLFSRTRFGQAIVKNLIRRFESTVIKATKADARA
jgi:SAM-dependent methyltransferase